MTGQRLAERYKIGNFTNMERIFWPRKIAGAAQARSLAKSPEPFLVLKGDTPTPVAAQGAGHAASNPGITEEIRATDRFAKG